MTQRTYLINAGGKTHTIQLDHNRWTGQRHITLDGVLVEKSGRFYQYDSTHQVIVDDVFVEIGIVATQTGFGYVCECSNEIVRAEEDKRSNKPISALEKDVAQTLKFWREFERLSGLKCLTPINAQGLGRYRYAGYIKERFVLVELAYLETDNNFKVALRILTRCNEQSNLKEKSKAIKTALEVTGIKIEDKHIYLDERNLQVYLAYDPKNHSALDTLTQIQKLIDVTIDQLAPQMNRVCEGFDCKQRVNQSTHLVFINNNPQFLCADCVSHLPELGTKLKQMNDKAPVKLGNGLLVTALAAIGLTILWAAMSTVLTVIGNNRDFLDLALFLGALIPLLTFFLYMQIADRISLTNAALALVIGLFAVPIGVYLNNLFTVIYFADSKFQLDFFAEAWRIVQGSRSKMDLVLMLISCSFMLGFLFFVKLLFSVRNYKKRFFSPVIEVVPDSVWRTNV